MKAIKSILEQRNEKESYKVMNKMKGSFPSMNMPYTFRNVGRYRLYKRGNKSPNISYSLKLAKKNVALNFKSIRPKLGSKLPESSPFA